MQQASDSVSYGRIPGRYHEAPGGAEWADLLGAAVEPWLGSGSIYDLGAGTGVVSERLAEPNRVARNGGGRQSADRYPAPT